MIWLKINYKEQTFTVFNGIEPMFYEDKFFSQVKEQFDGTIVIYLPDSRTISIPPQNCILEEIN